MRVAAIGVGGAGGRIVDALARDNAARPTPYLAATRALDTDTAALAALESLPSDSRVAFGHSETQGSGTDGDRTCGTAAFDADRYEVRRAIESAITSDVTAVVFVAGVGGGTGSGATPHLIHAIQDITDCPIYAVTVLPANPDAQATSNAARGLDTIGDVADAQLVLDTDAWTGTDPLAETRAGLNQALADRLGTLFAAGEATSTATVGQQVIDAQEVIATLDAGGMASLGYARQDLSASQNHQPDSLLGRLRTRLFGTTDDAIDDVTAIKAVETTLHRAVNGRLTLECRRDTAARALLVVAGPPDGLHQKAIAEGRAWLSNELDTVALRSGDAPVPDGRHLTVLVVLAGVTNTVLAEADP